MKSAHACACARLAIWSGSRGSSFRAPSAVLVTVLSFFNVWRRGLESSAPVEVGLHRGAPAVSTAEEHA